jgi:hypothetical protein
MEAFKPQKYRNKKLTQSAKHEKCVSCNITKSAKDPIKHMQEIGFLL